MHWGSLFAMNFMAVDTLFGKRFYLLLIVEMRTRKIKQLNGTIKREALDHFLLFSEKQVRNIIQSYVTYYKCIRVLIKSLILKF